MTNLESALENVFYARVTSQGIDYSHFDLSALSDFVAGTIFSNNAGFGVVIEDDHGKATEIYGAFRRFHRRAALTRPVKPVAHLHNEEIELTPSLFEQVAKFFQSISTIDPPMVEAVSRWEGEFKRVEVTHIMPYKKWWNGMFVDVYVNNHAVIEKFSALDGTSRKVLHETEKWRRYERARRYIQIMQEEQMEFTASTSGEKPDPKKLDLTEKDLLHFLQRHASYLKPLFRSSEDYLYFLLGFAHAGFSVKNIHAKVLQYFEEQKTLERYVREFNCQVDKLEFASTYPKFLTLAPKYEVIGELVIKEELDAAYERVVKNGKRIKSPATNSEDLWLLGFHPLQRGRWKREVETAASYALLKIKGRRNEAQRSFPFAQGDRSIDLEPVDYTPHLKVPADFF